MLCCKHVCDSSQGWWCLNKITVKLNVQAQQNYAKNWFSARASVLMLMLLVFSLAYLNAQFRGVPAFTRKTANAYKNFSLLNTIFLYLTGYNTEGEIKSSYTWVHKVMLCNFNIGNLFNTLADECAWVRVRIVFSLLVLWCKTDISACNCITGNPNTVGKRN